MPDLGPLIDAAKTGAEKLGKMALESHPGIADAWAQTQKLIMPMSREFNKTEIGKDAMSLIHDQYYPKLRDGMQKRVAVEANLPEHLKTPSHIIRQEVANTAKAATFGKNNSVGSSIINTARQLHGDLYAANLADHMAMVLHDNNFKRSIKFDKENPFKELSMDSVYKGHRASEDLIQKFNSVILAPFIAIPHLTNIANVALTTPLSSIGLGMAQILKHGGLDQARTVLHDSGILANMMLDAHGDRLAFRNGVFAKAARRFTSTDEQAKSVGYWLNRGIHQPFFSPVREWTLLAAGSVGKINAERMSQRYFESGGTDKRALNELKEMGINPLHVMRQRGQLNSDQIGQAIYKYTDNKVFLDNQLHRSYYSGSSPLFRMATMFHGFVTRQGGLMKHEFMKAARSKDLGLIAQFALTAGVAFPVVGEGIKQLEELGRGQDTSLGEDVEQFTEGGALQKMDVTMDAFAHMASFGIWLLR